MGIMGIFMYVRHRKFQKSFVDDGAYLSFSLKYDAFLLLWNIIVCYQKLCEFYQNIYIFLLVDWVTYLISLDKNIDCESNEFSEKS